MARAWASTAVLGLTILLAVGGALAQPREALKKLQVAKNKALTTASVQERRIALGLITSIGKLTPKAREAVVMGTLELAAAEERGAGRHLLTCIGDCKTAWCAIAKAIKDCVSCECEDDLACPNEKCPYGEACFPSPNPCTVEGQACRPECNPASCPYGEACFPSPNPCTGPGQACRVQDTCSSLQCECPLAKPFTYMVPSCAGFGDAAELKCVPKAAPLEVPMVGACDTDCTVDNSCAVPQP